jgi:F0F1-type ATP synthase membrane subunit c/vacuolar-type H+-ATPase subunit K
MKSSTFNTSIIKSVLALAVVAVLVLFVSLPAFATESDVPAPAEDITTVGADEQPAQISEKSVKAIVAAAIVGLVASVGAVGMTIAVSKSTSNIARQPEAYDKI